MIYFKTNSNIKPILYILPPSSGKTGIALNESHWCSLSARYHVIIVKCNTMGIQKIYHLRWTNNTSYTQIVNN
jgi:hypothetical protein